MRDANSGSIVEQFTGEEPVYNLDPVLTYDYMNCCDRIPQIEATEKYLILYAYAGRISNEEADWIAEYAKKKNLKVYAIGGIQKCADRFVDCSPFEVLAYFRNAEEVITDTFHILTELPKYCDEKGNIDPAKLDHLMPWAEELPEECRKPRRS